MSNGPDSNLYGLQPNFGCCTANMHQGWPKLAASLWMATGDGGLAAVAYGPSEVTSGGVTIEERTDYPFRENVTLLVKAARQAAFPLAGKQLLPTVLEVTGLIIVLSAVAGLWAVTV